ncbi:MAG: CRTAC1 family protein, partial [Bacteroidota bacterium]
ISTTSLQNVFFSTTTPLTITACGEVETFEIEYFNGENQALTGQQISISLPPGIFYEPSSVSLVQGGQVSEANISDLRNPVFSVADLAAGGTQKFSLQYTANLQAVTYLLNGQTPSNDISLQANEGSAAYTSESYNVLYAALTIMNLNPTAQSGSTGDTVSRSMTIINGGNGEVTSFFITDTYGAGLDLISTSIGTLNASHDTIFFDAGDLATIGNGDGIFNTNESFTLEEDFTISGCTNGPVSSVIEAHWGCQDSSYLNSSTNATITIDVKSPNISHSGTSELKTCFSPDTLNQQTITLKNNGDGKAINAGLTIYKSTGGNYNQNIFSRIDTASITLQQGTQGSPVKISPTSVKNTRNDGRYACLGTNPIGEISLSLPELLPGETYIITFKTASCCVDACLGEKPNGWKYNLTYQDPCSSTPVNASKKVESTASANMSIFSESPTDVRHGQEAEFNFMISSHSNRFPSGPYSTYEVTFSLPEGMLWMGKAGDLNWHSGKTSWSASSITFDASNRVLTARFPLPVPFNLPKSSLDLSLTADCNQITSSDPTDQRIGLDIAYIPDTTCTQLCNIPILCSEEESIHIHCPGPCAQGLKFDAYTFSRTSLGLPDNDQNGAPDNSSQLDFDQIKPNRAMYSDTLRGTMTGIVKTSQSYPSFSYGYASSTIEQGSNLSVLAVGLRVYDASAGSYLSCQQVPYTTSVQGNAQIFTFDFSPASLNGTCADFLNFQFGDGDSIWLDADYKVSGNIGGAVVVADIDNEFYLSDVANPTSAGNKLSCDNWGGSFTLIGYFFKVDKAQNVTIQGCNKYISQNYYLSIGDCCSNYNGGNLFPYEYRNWAHVQRAEVVIPPNYTVLNAFMRERRTRYTNASYTTTVQNLQADSTSGDTLRFDLSQYYQPKGGSIPLSDDGFKGTLYIKLAPTCEVPLNTYQDMSWKFTFTESSRLSGQETDWYDGGPDRVRFSPPAIALSSPQPTIDGLSKTVRWTLNVKNTSSSSGSDNVWLHTKAPSGQVNIQSIVEISNNDTLSQSGNIYQIGAVDKNKTRKFYITATYSNCAPDYIKVYSGYECSGYPSTFADFTCSYTSMELHMEPKEPELQVIVEGERIGGTCGNQIRVSLELASVKLATVDSSTIRISLPSDNGFTLVPGSVEMKYPLSDTFKVLADPTITDQSFRYYPGNHEAQLEDGLPGIVDVSKNRLQFRFLLDITNSYQPGDYVDISVGGKKACGQALPQINLAYDFRVKFKKPTNTGLTVDTGDSWGASWGDFDNDGYEDLFVSEGAHWKGAYLYHNQGDGTFVKITTGDLVNDKGFSGGGTWGDYDNDGDLDLFVANNVRADNHLYQNDGSGNFTRVDAGEISQYGGYCHNASWVDYDNDGHLDMFVSDYMPTKYNLLYRSNGDGTFSRATDNPIAMEAKFSMGATWGDYDNDGLQDLFVPNGNNQNNSLYHNDGNGKFTKLTTGEIVNDGGNSGGSAWGDFDNDGDLDLYVTNASNQANFFYINNGDGSFSKNTSAIIATDLGHSHGSEWADIDNDGDLDLFVTNDQAGKNRLYLNEGDGTFVVRKSQINDDQENSLATAMADIDNDGDLDIFVANVGQENSLYLNDDGQCANYKCIKLVGQKANRSAIGARLKAKAHIYGQDVWQMRDIKGQTGGGASSQSTLKAYFGLGDATQIDTLIIEWPSGFVQTLTQVGLNDCEEIVEASGVLISGKVYYDLNQNCQLDSGEVGIPNIMLEVNPGNKYVVTDKDGFYKMYREYGDYSIEAHNSADWTFPCTTKYDISYTTDVNNLFNYTNYHFAVQPNCAGPDASIGLSSTALRRGFKNTFAVSWANEGALAAYQTAVHVEFDKDIVILSADYAWDSVAVLDSTIRYTWVLDSLMPMERKTVMLTDSVSVNAPLGKMVSTKGYFSSIANECDSTDNLRTATDQIVGAVDPNDLLVSPEGAILETDTLTYKVRFQNIGTSYAKRVIIRDTLSPYLDWASLRVLASSHDYDMKLNDGGELRFTFDHIYLPDSLSNEPLSHGSIEFQLLPGQGYAPGTEIRNQAAIQFDLSQPLLTNETMNYLVDRATLHEQAHFQLEIQ